MCDLPAGWSAALDTSREPFEVYYYHAATGVTSWDPPRAPEQPLYAIADMDEVANPDDQAKLFLEVLRQQFCASLPASADMAGFGPALRVLWDANCASPRWDVGRRNREFDAFTSSLHTNAQLIRMMCGLPAL